MRCVPLCMVIPFPLVICLSVQHLTHGIVGLLLIQIDRMNGDHMLYHTITMMNGLVVYLQDIGRIRFPGLRRRVVPRAIEIVRLIGTDRCIFLLCYIGRVNMQDQFERRVATILCEGVFLCRVDRTCHLFALLSCRNSLLIVNTIEQGVLPCEGIVVTNRRVGYFLLRTTDT